MKTQTYGNGQAETGALAGASNVIGVRRSARVETPLKADDEIGGWMMALTHGVNYR